MIINEPHGVPMWHFSERSFHCDETVSVTFNRTNPIQLNGMLFGAGCARARSSRFPLAHRHHFFFFNITYDICEHFIGSLAVSRRAKMHTICKFYGWWFESLIKMDLIYLVVVSVWLFFFFFCFFLRSDLLSPSIYIYNPLQRLSVIDWMKNLK